ncbi:MAG: NAD(P)H-binding protein [Pricia sp.]
MKTQKILVLGATGKTGRRVATRLEKLNYQVRKGSRQEDPSFDWDDSTTWPGALQDMDAVYITFQPDLAVPGALETIKAFSTAMVSAGIQKVVLLSGRGETEAERCEQVIMDSGLDWTIVRASWFNQNFSESFFLDSILAGHVALPKNDALVPYIDADDIADVVVEVLLKAEHSGKIYELTGPQQFTFEQVMQKISQAAEREVKFEPIPLEAYISGMKEAGVPEDYVWLIGYLFTEILTEENAVITNDVEHVLGRKPKDFETYARETAATGVWDSNR